MSYDHSEKAGNEGDVWKHFILTVIAESISIPSNSFHYIDCHSGAPIHDLRYTHKWKRGVGKLLGNEQKIDNNYVNFARIHYPKYPSGWLFVANVLATRFTSVRVTLFDTDENFSELYSLFECFSSNVKVEFINQDGYEGHRNIEQSDWIFFDPPCADWASLKKSCQNLQRERRTFAAWYPFYRPTGPRKLSRHTQCEAWEVHWGPCTSKSTRIMKGCGMLVSDDIAGILREREAELQAFADCLGWRLIPNRPE